MYTELYSQCLYSQFRRSVLPAKLRRRRCRPNLEHYSANVDFVGYIILTTVNVLIVRQNYRGQHWRRRRLYARLRHHDTTFLFFRHFSIFLA